jgi:RND family efflux transporter MFP subunit
VRRNLGSQSQLDEARQAVLRQDLAVTSRALAIQDHPTRLAQLEARLDRVRAQLALAELDVERTQVTAPFAGQVSRVAVAPGTRVRPGDRLLDLYASDSLEVRAQVPGTLVGALREALAERTGLHATGHLEGAAVGLELDRFAGEVARGSAGLDALFRVTRGGGSLPLGRFVEITVDLPVVTGAVDLPREALYGADRIYKVVDGRMHALRVERLGVMRRAGESEDRMLVRSPELRGGDLVVVTQLSTAMDGVRVQPAAGGGE